MLDLPRNSLRREPPAPAGLLTDLGHDGVVLLGGLEEDDVIALKHTLPSVPDSSDNDFADLVTL